MDARDVELQEALPWWSRRDRLDVHMLSLIAAPRRETSARARVVASVVQLPMVIQPVSTIFLRSSWQLTAAEAAVAS